MKKSGLLCLTVALIVGLGACFNNNQALKSKPKLLEKEGIAPYELSGEDLYLLESIEFKNPIHLISYKAPVEVTTMRLNVYYLNDNNEWVITEYLEGKSVEFSLSSDEEIGQNNQFQGTLSIKNKGNEIEFIFNDNLFYGVHAVAINEFTDEIDLRGYSYLSEFQEIELNKEIPILICTYTNNSGISTYELDAFNTPEVFNGLDHVQAITITFTNE